MIDAKLGEDPVLEAYDNLTETCDFIETKEEFIARAQMRKILGNPPISPDRHSVCDELMWEELLDFCKEDLILVSKDRAFTENKKILRDEFSQVNDGKTLTIVNSVSEALGILGKVSDRIEATEAELDFNTKHILSRAANNIMEIAIRKSSPIISRVDRDVLALTIRNVTLRESRSGDPYLSDAISELESLGLIEDVGNGVYKLTEKGREFDPFVD